MPISRQLQDDVYKLLSGRKESDKLIEELVELASQGHDGECRPSTLINRMSLIKKMMIAEKCYSDEFLHKVKAPKDLVQKYLDDVAERRAQRQNTCVKKATYQKLIDLKDRPDTPSQILYLMFATGRRLNEVVKDEFKILKRPKKNELMFSHLSKQKGDMVGKKQYVQIIPDADIMDVIKRFKRVRQEVKSLGMSVKDVNNRIAPFVKQILGKEFHPHSIRGLYALYMWTYVDKKKQNRQGYISKILNHQSYDTSLSYCNFVESSDDDDEKE